MKAEHTLNDAVDVGKEKFFSSIYFVYIVFIEYFSWLWVLVAIILRLRWLDIELGTFWNFTTQTGRNEDEDDEMGSMWFPRHSIYSYAHIIWRKKIYSSNYILVMQIHIYVREIFFLPMFSNIVQYPFCQLI